MVKTLNSDENRPAKISFLTIVLNGMPFIPFHYKAIYEFAHEIIYVEGACPNASENATIDGHSNDGTLKEIKRLMQEGDPYNKVKLITAEDCGHPSGFWPKDKDQMCEEGAKLITGDWLWALDSDEFYLPGDIKKIIETYLITGKADMISLPNKQFWGGIDYVYDGWRFIQHGIPGGAAPRIFRWSKGYIYSTHRPITILNKSGNDLRNMRWIKAKELLNQNIFIMHYSYLFPKQVEEKCKYYSRMDWGYSKMYKWYRGNYLHIKNPFNVDAIYMYPSWLERYTGKHPPQILHMWKHLTAHHSSLIRNNEDIEKFLEKRFYSFGRLLLKSVPPYLIRGIEIGARAMIRSFRGIKVGACSMARLFMRHQK
ncbi:MAG: hypothetical protein WC340_04170 [Kiritimatiellia bacterium]